MLESTGSSVDKQANRSDQSVPGAKLNPGRLNGSQGVTTFLKDTLSAAAQTAVTLRLPKSYR